jgi:methylated-DNA-[protein]-cysteine S-methyltransferase
VVGYTLFDTAIGSCGIVWTARGVSGFLLPEPTSSATRHRLLSRFQGAIDTSPPPAIRQVIEAVTALLNGERGERTDLAFVPVDMDGLPEFHQRVYEVARTIPPGATLTYGEIAARLGDPGSARAVGQALGHNPIPVIVPCHRVLAAGGRRGGFSAPGGTATKLNLLALEGAQLF